jgi:hypothetical protein
VVESAETGGHDAPFIGVCALDTAAGQLLVGAWRDDEVRANHTHVLMLLSSRAACCELAGCQLQQRVCNLSRKTAFMWMCTVLRCCQCVVTFNVLTCADACLCSCITTTVQVRLRLRTQLTGLRPVEVVLPRRGSGAMSAVTSRLVRCGASRGPEPALNELPASSADADDALKVNMVLATVVGRMGVLCWDVCEL